MSNDNPKDVAYFTVRETADKLGVTQQRVRQLCGAGDLRAVKENGVWLVDKSAVRGRFAIRPPKVRAGQEKVLEELRSQIRELREENRSLAVRLEAARASKAPLRQGVENLTQMLKERERELAVERESHRRSKEELSQELEDSRAKIQGLERQIRDGSPAPLGDKRPRILKDPGDDPGSRRRRPSE